MAMENKVSTVGLAIVGIVFVAAVVVSVYGLLQVNFVSSLQSAVEIVLTAAIDFLYLVGAALIVLGSILVTIRYVKSKIRAPFQPFAGLPRARYLTISLEIFIGAEVIKTVVARNYDDFAFLALTIGIRGLVALILYLERRWHGTEDAPKPT
jgi:uncharacterized membrane protein